ncbi:MAG: hypothetical protein RMJ97_09350, partial [Raineya sp.]|nr:hypothetical protein [Raineya sp.]MDW8297070.1 hypothetical protein [Raineya sp.]
MTKINNVYFEYSQQVYNIQSPNEVVPVVLKYIQPQTVLDLGCGIGFWLKVFASSGVQEYLGIDGEYV